MIDKVIFLDIDGVLNVYCQGRDEYMMHKQHIGEWKRRSKPYWFKTI